MNRKTQLICKQYRKELRKQFPILRKMEKAYLKNLEMNLNDFYEDQSITSIEEIYREFGSPQEAVQTYYMLNHDSLLSSMHIGKRIHSSVLFLCGILIVSVLFIGSMLFWIKQSIPEKEVYYISTTTTILE